MILVYSDSVYWLILEKDDSGMQKTSEMLYILNEGVMKLWCFWMENIYDPLPVRLSKCEQKNCD